MKELFDYQAEDLKRALDGEHKALFMAWEMALGKTLFTAHYAKAVGANVIIVVCPLNTRTSWAREFKEVMPDMPIYRLVNDKKNVENFHFLGKQRRGVYLIGWELMRKGVLFGEHADLLVADETHRQQGLGNPTSTNIKAINAEYKVALSGTPAANRPEGIFSTLMFLWPKKYKSLYNWIDKFWRTRRNGQVIDLLRELEPGAVIADIPFFSRRLRKDHRDDTKPVMPEILVDCPMYPAQRHIYDQFDTDSLAWLGDVPESVSFPLVKAIRLRQVALGVPTVVDGLVTFATDCKSSKIDALVEIINDQPVEDTFLVLTHSAKFVPAVVAQLEKKGITARGFTGQNSADQKDAALDEFGNKFRVLVAGIAAIGEGTDGLQYKCHNMVWLSKHPDAMLNTQASGRLDRPGQEEAINSWYLFAPDSDDVKSMERLEEVQEVLDELLDAHPVK